MQTARNWLASPLGLLPGVLLIGSLLSFVPGGTAPGEFSRMAVLSTATPPATVLAETPILFEDDFSTYSRRWQETSSPKSRVLYRDGMLTMLVVSPGVRVWSVPDFIMPGGSFALRVAYAFRGGSMDSAAGCLLLTGGEEDLLAFLVTRAGDWRVERYVDDSWQPVAAGATDRDLDSKQVDLRIDVEVDVIILWIDGVMAGRLVLNDSLAVTGLGLIAHAGRGYVDAAFDYVAVGLPSGGTDVWNDH